MSLSPDYIFMQNLSQVTAAGFFSLESKDYLVSGDEAGKLTFWDITVYKKLLTLEAHSSKILAIRVNRSVESSGKILLTQSKGVVKVWVYVDFPLCFRVSESYTISKISVAQFSALPLISGDLILAAASSNHDQSISIFHQNRETILTPQSNQKLGLLMAVELIILNELQIYLLTGHESGSLKCFQLTVQEDSCHHKELSSLDVYKDIITALDFDSLTMRGVCGSVDGKMKIFSLKQSSQDSVTLELLREVNLTNPGISCVNIRRDSRILAAGGWDSKVRIFSWKSLKPLAVIDYHNGGINAVIFSHMLKNSKKFMLAICSNDKTVSLWSLYNNPP